MKAIFLVTCGSCGAGPDPGMTPAACLSVSRLRSSLPENPSAVICGTGRRHRDVSVALGLIPTRITAVVGGPESMEPARNKQFIMLAQGVLVPPERYTTIADLGPSIQTLIHSLPDQTVICAGRTALAALGFQNPEPAQVYEITCGGKTGLSICEVCG